MPVLKGEVWGTFVAPTAALCFILCGLAIVLRISKWRIVSGFGLLLGIAVTLFAAATLAEYAFAIDLGIDRLFFAHRLSDWTLPVPGRFAFNTTIGFIFAGLSICALRRQKGIGLTGA